MNSEYERRLWEVLEKEKLTDLSQFHRVGFDEVPLFSRESDLEFLPQENGAAREMLLRFALKFLNAVIAYEKHPTGYFAAITLWDVPSERLVPNLFAWCGNTGRLKEKLALDHATTPFAKGIKKVLPKLHLVEKLEVREDTSTDPDATRVFVAPGRAPYKGFLPLTALGKRARARSAK